MAKSSSETTGRPVCGNREIRRVNDVNDVLVHRLLLDHYLLPKKLFTEKYKKGITK